MSYIVLSKKKLQEIVEEVSELSKKRPEILKQIDEAIQLGDLSENAEYIEAKRKLRECDKRTLKLNNILKNAIVEDECVSKDHVDIFATVTLENIQDNSRSEFTLVSEEESSLFENKLSIISPLGAVLNQKKVNDIVEFKAPRGVMKYKIVQIKY